MYCMRALVATVFSVSLLTVGAAASTTNAHVVRSHGISVALPQTWHLTDELLSVCTSPGQVMAITNSSVPIGKKVRKGIALIGPRGPVLKAVVLSASSAVPVAPKSGTSCRLL
jgi:hypothetical protein